MPERITIKQVAEELGVSMMTVSRALNDRPNVDARTKKRVLETAKKMGYIQNHIAKSLVQRKTFTVGIVVPEISHSFFPDAMKGMEEVLYAAGYQIIFVHSAEDADRESKAMETLASKRVDGILISTAESVTDYSTYKNFVNIKLPIVFFDRVVKNIGCSCVGINDEESAFKLTEHLIKKGIKKFAHLAGKKKISVAASREKGFLKALKKHLINIDKKMVITAGLNEDDGYSAMQLLLENETGNLPEAVVCVNDPCAFGALKAIKEKGLKVPKDISIVGFSDDIRSELMKPPLTTVIQPAYEIGKRAAEKLLAHIENDDEKIENIHLDTSIVYRKSVR